jgi:uncharacterized protein (DUF433 family)
MSGREIKARTVLEDVRAGMSDAELMDKYKLSARGLRSLYLELTNLGLLEERDREVGQSAPTRIRIKEFVQDVRSKMKDTELMEKYKLSSEALHMLFSKLLGLKALSREDLFGHDAPVTRDTTTVSVREWDRYELDFELNIFDAFHPEIRGAVRDITEQGLGVEGMDSSVGDVKTFLISPDEFLDISPFVFKAECRWHKDQELDGSTVAGFKIVDISPDNLAAMRKLLGLLVL